MKKGMMQNREWKSSFWYFIASLFSKALAFVTIPLYTRMLSSSDYGYLNTYGAWVALGSVLIGFGLQSAIHGIQKNKEYETGEFQASVMSLSLVIFCLAAVGAGTLRWFGVLKIEWIILFCLLFQSYAAFIISFVSQQMVLENRYRKYTFLNVAAAVIPVVFSVVLLLDKRQRITGYMAVILPKVLVTVLFMAPLLFYTLKKGKKLYQPGIWKWSLSYCLPLVFHVLSLNILSQFDRIMLSDLKGYEVTGEYSFIYNCTLAISVVISALENTWKSWFYQAMKKGEKMGTINRRAGNYAQFVTMCAVLFLLISPEFIRIMAPVQYWGGIPYIPLLLMGFLVSFFYDFPVYVEYYEKHTGYIAVISSLSAGLNILLNDLWIPVWGGAGAAAATFCSYLLQFFLHLRISHQYQPKLFGISLFGKKLLLAGTGVVLFYMGFHWPVIRWAGAGVLLLLWGLAMLKKIRQGMEHER